MLAYGSYYVLSLSLFSPCTVEGVEKLIDPLRSTIQSKAKANSVKQEYEKQDELKRSAMRAVAALLTIPESGELTYLLPQLLCIT